MITLRTNVWKSNDNLAAIKQFNAHPQYNAARIDYDYAFIEMVSNSPIHITYDPFDFQTDCLHLTFRLKNLSLPNTFNQSASFQSIQIQKIMFQSMVTLAQHPAGDIHNMTHLEIQSLSQVQYHKN